MNSDPLDPVDPVGPPSPLDPAAGPDPSDLSGLLARMHDEALAWQMQADGNYQRPGAPIHAPRNVQQALMLRYHTVAAPAPERHHTQRAARHP